MHERTFELLYILWPIFIVFGMVLLIRVDRSLAHCQVVDVQRPTLPCPSWPSDSPVALCLTISLILMLYLTFTMFESCYLCHTTIFFLIDATKGKKVEESFFIVHIFRGKKISNLFVNDGCNNDILLIIAIYICGILV